MDIAVAGAWLADYERFWQCRVSFFLRAFGLAGDEPGAASQIAAAPEFVALNPVAALRVWEKTLAETGQGLTREAAAKLATMTVPERLAQLHAALRALGFTAAGGARFAADFLRLERDDAFPAGFWEWLAEAEAVARRAKKPR